MEGERIPLPGCHLRVTPKYLTLGPDPLSGYFAQKQTMLCKALLGVAQDQKTSVTRVYAMIHNTKTSLCHTTLRTAKDPQYGSAVEMIHCGPRQK